MKPERRDGAAIVVGGAVAKGAFAAGALAHLTLKLRADGTPIRAVVGTSSGALNATVIAAGVAAGRPVSAAKELVRLWRDRGSASRILDVDPWSAARFGGVCGSRRVVELLDEACARLRGGASPAGVTQVALRLVVAPLAGTAVGTGATARTSFEAVERFERRDFGDRARRRRMFEAAVASAAFPYAFKPVAVGELGPCVDGGIVNNTPIKQAIEPHADIGTVYVIVADPADSSLPPERAAELRGVGLLTRLVEMLVNERLVRDLAEARAVNAWLATLDGLVERRELTASARAEVVEGLYGRDAKTFRRLELVEIRPDRPLEGGSFSGFFSADLRRAYLREGWDAAQKACSRRGPRPAPSRPRAPARRPGSTRGAASARSGRTRRPRTSPRS
jgi:predicted acylesterase/phospholipase RssA